MKISNVYSKPSKRGRKTKIFASEYEINKLKGNSDIIQKLRNYKRNGIEENFDPQIFYSNDRSLNNSKFIKNISKAFNDEKYFEFFYTSQNNIMREVSILPFQAEIFLQDYNLCYTLFGSENINEIENFGVKRNKKNK